GTAIVVVGHFIEGDEANALVALHVVEQALKHEQHLRATRDVRVDRDGKNRVVVFAVDPVELIAPHLLDMAGIDEAMAIGRLLDEHHGRQVIKIPVGGDLDQPGFVATDRKSTRLNSSHVKISYAVFCLKKKTEPKTM